MSGDAEFILKAMAIMAAADRRLDAREVRLIQNVYLEQTGEEVDVSGVMMAVQAYATKRDALAELAAAAGGMSETTKEAIIRSAYATKLANEHISDGERRAFTAIVEALRLSETALNAILEKNDLEKKEQS